jgi:6-phosphogluconolactonase
MPHRLLMVVIAVGCAGSRSEPGAANGGSAGMAGRGGGAGTGGDSAAAAGGTGPALADAATPMDAVSAPAGDATAVADGSRDPAPPGGDPFVYVGSQLDDRIHVFQLDMQSGALRPRGTVPSGMSPGYLAFHPSRRFVYAENEVEPGFVVAFSVDRETGMLTQLGRRSSGGDRPAHISVHKSGKWLLTANYVSGHVAALPIGDDGRLGDPVAPIFAGRMAHMIVDDGVTGDFVFVPSKGDDRVLQYRFDQTTGRLTPNSPAFVAQAGAPRHMVFHRSGRHAFLLTEAGRSVISYRYDPATGLLGDGQAQLASPPAGAFTDGAHILMHPSKEIVYASIRGYDSIAVFPIDAQGRVSPPAHMRTQVARPWDFSIDPTGTYMLVANNDNATIKVYRLDPETGMPVIVGNGAVVAPRPRFVGIMHPPD